MRCYYEELGVSRDSNEGDIKTAYRKLALRWHPDKNPDCLAEAKERFQLIQQAYEVLSDAQERAWYDNHREQILRGKNSEYSENCLDVFQYFTGSCYKGYGSDSQSFYSVYRDVFNKIASEDLEFMDSDDEMGAPQFGNANSSYEEVVGPFYAYWLSYSTKKTYEWLCPYDVREIKERFILRKVDKEMKKIVQNARKERNEEVRNLVSFVRKRDRRVQAYRRILEERAEANRVKQEEKRKEQLRQRQEQLTAARANKVANDGYEEQLRQLEQQYGSESDDYTDDADEEGEGEDEAGEGSDALADSDNNLSEDEVEYVDDLYCVACNKSFKNAKARANHEESKKHRDNVERLCQQMEAEENEFNEANSEDLIAAEESLEDLQLNGSHESDPNDNVELGSDDAVEQQLGKRNKKNKKSRRAAPKAVVASDDEDDAAEPPVDFTAVASNSEDDDGDDWSKSKKAAKKTKSKKSANNKQKPETEQKPAPEAKSAAAQPKPAPSPARGGDEPPPTGQHTCVTCKLVFDSKNKLFAHLKKTNHGVYIPKAKPEVEGKPPGKGKGRRK